jgi:hypothetical protein
LDAGGGAAQDSSTPTPTLHPPVVLASGQQNPTSIVSDGRFVYWTNDVASGSILRCDLGGCAGGPDVLSTGEQEPDGLVLASRGPAWINRTGAVARILTADVDGGTTCSEVGVTSMASAGEFLLIGAANGAALCNASELCRTYCSGFLFGWPIRAGATADQVVYFATDQEIRSCPLNQNRPCVAGSGVPGSLVASGEPGVRAFVVDDVRVYWVDDTTGTVKSIPKGGGEATVLAKDQNRPWRLALDGEMLYFVNRGTAADGEIARIPTGSGPVVKLASGLVRPYDLVVTAKGIIFTVSGATTGDGKVMSITK